MAATKSKAKATPKPPSAVMQVLMSGLGRAKGVLTLDPKMLKQVEQQLSPLKGKALAAALDELVRFSAFLRTKHKSPLAGDALLQIADRVVGAAKKTAAGWALKK